MQPSNIKASRFHTKEYIGLACLQKFYPAHDQFRSKFWIDTETAYSVISQKFQIRRKCAVIVRCQSQTKCAVIVNNNALVSKICINYSSLSFNLNY